MKIVPPPEPRAAVGEHDGVLEFVIPSPRDLGFTVLSAFGSAMGCFFVLVLLVAVVAVIASEEPGAPLLALVVFLLFMGSVVLLQLMALGWSVAGRERVTVTESVLSLRRELRFLRRTRNYDLRHVARLRTEPYQFQPFALYEVMGLLGSGGPMTFDYGSSTVRFGAGLSAVEASDVLERLRSHPSVSGSADS